MCHLCTSNLQGKGRQLGDGVIMTKSKMLLWQLVLSECIVIVITCVLLCMNIYAVTVSTTSAWLYFIVYLFVVVCPGISILWCLFLCVDFRFIVHLFRVCIFTIIV